MNATYPVVVGTFTITEEESVTELYETAAWHKTIKAPVGVYEVTAYVGRPVNDVYIRFVGPITSSHFGAGGGVEKVGEVVTVSRNMYMYQAVEDDRFIWNDRINFDGDRPKVSRDKLEDIALTVDVASTHEVNSGHPSAFWAVCVNVKTNRWGFRSLRLTHQFTGDNAGHAARAMVAKVQTAGTICPAHWKD